MDFEIKQKEMPKKEDADGWRAVAASAYEWLESVAFALAIVVLLFTFILRILSVSGDSMIPTLHDEDRVIVSCLFYTPEDGDIVIVMPSEYGYSRPLIKRVIATEGQTVDIVDGIVYVDGVMLDDGFPQIVPERMGDAFEYPVTVPEGHVFVMGDNRNNSTDSRSSLVGMVDNKTLLGKVIFRIYPFGDMGSFNK